LFETCGIGIVNILRDFDYSAVDYFLSFYQYGCFFVMSSGLSPY